MIMMGDDKKRIVSSILGDEPGLGDKEGNGDEDPKHAIARDMLDSIKSDDHEGLAEACSAMNTYCNGGMSGEG